MQAENGEPRDEPAAEEGPLLPSARDPQDSDNKQSDSNYRW